MTAPRVTKRQKADLARRKVRTVGQRRIGQYKTKPRTKVLPTTRPSRRTVRRAAATTGFLGLLTAVFSFAGAVFTAAGAVTTAAGGLTVAWIEYRRDLLEVQRTGRPVGSPTPAKPAQQKKSAPKKPAPQQSASTPAEQSTDDLEDRPEPTPVDLDVCRCCEPCRSGRGHCAGPDCRLNARHQPPPKPARKPKASAGKAIRRHADGTICHAQSDKTCRKGGSSKRKPKARTRGKMS